MEDDRLNQIANVMEVGYFGTMAALGALAQAPESLQRQFPVWLLEEEPTIAVLAFGCLLIGVLGWVGEKLVGAKTSIAIGILGLLGLIAFVVTVSVPKAFVSESAPLAVNTDGLRQQNQSLKRENARLRTENTRLRAATPIATPIESRLLREQDFIDITKAQEILDNAKALESAAWNRYHLVMLPASSNPNLAVPRPPYNSNDLKMAYDDVNSTKQVEHDAQVNLDNLNSRLCGQKQASP